MKGAPGEHRKQKVVVTISSGPNGDRSTVGLTIANAALSAGMEVLVFLISDGVDLVRDGAASLAHFYPFRSLSELIESFVRNGGTFVACGSCFQYRGLRPESTVEGAQVGGVGTLIEWLQSNPTVISL